MTTSAVHEVITGVELGHFETLRIVSSAPGIIDIQFNRPEVLNAWNPRMAQDLGAAIELVRTHDECRAVVLSGAGRSFCAGADIKAPDAHKVVGVQEHLSRLRDSRHNFNELDDLPVPVVAAVRGHAVGVGFLLLLCCDFVVVAPDTRLWLSQVALGIIPAFGGTQRLSRALGRIRASDIVLNGRKISGVEAVTWGLATRLAPSDEVLEVAHTLAGSLAALSPTAVRLAKESLVRGGEAPLREASLTDLYRSMVAMLSNEGDEAHRAWRERRTGAKGGSGDDSGTA